MLNVKKTIKSSLKNEIYSLIDNRVNQLIETYNKYVQYSKSDEFKDHKRLYEFGLGCSQNVITYRRYLKFMGQYPWLIEKHDYYSKKYPDMLFVDELLNDRYFFDRYKNGSTSQVRMMGTMFSGDISISDLDVIEKNLLRIDNKDRMVYHHFHTNCGETLCFGDLETKEQKLVFSDNNDWRFMGVEIIAHSSFLFNDKPNLTEYWGVVLCPVDKGFLVLHRFN